MIAAFISDLLTAWRGLARSPMLLTSASLVLGLGLGATVFVFTVMNTLYLKPPPYRDAERLYRVFGRHDLTSEIQGEIQLDDFLRLRESPALEDAAAVSSLTAVITGGDAAQRFDGAEVTPNFFDFLGISPLLGRVFTGRDGLPGSEPVAILSASAWAGRYASDRGIVGRRIVVNGQTRTVVGILKPGFGLIGGEGVWLPITRDPASFAADGGRATGVWMLAKARAGAPGEVVEADLNTVMDRLQSARLRSDEALSLTLLPLGAGIIGHDSVRSLRHQMVWACVTLLIACLTVAGLLLVRSMYRQFETAMRSALGASRFRLVQLVFCEALVIAALGLGVAWCLSVLALEYYRGLIDAIGVYGGVPPWWTFEIDWRIGLFSAFIALLSALIAGIYPAIEASRRNVAALLHDRTSTSTSRRLSRFASVMVSVELAAAAALLSGACLLARGAYVSIDRDFGVDPGSVMTGDISLPEPVYAGERYIRFMNAVLDAIRSRPGVEGAAMTTSLPGLGAYRSSIALPGQENRSLDELPLADDVSISPGFFTAMGGRLVAGREFASGDGLESPRVAIVNAEFAERHFAGASPIGRRLAFRSEDGGPVEWHTVVGVVDNILHSATWGENGAWHPTVYTPLAQYTPSYVSVAVKGGGAPSDQSRMLREVVSSVDRDLPVIYVRPLAQAQSERRAGYQLSSVTVLGSSFIAVILAIAGLYVVLSFTVQRRTREFAVRRALGASDWQIATGALRGAALQAAIGLACGAALTPFVVTLASDLMEGLPSSQPSTYAFAFGVVALAAAAASRAPIRRALQVEPIILLRVD